MRVLVTGSAGFIGAALARELVEQGHHVATLDRQSGSPLVDRSLAYVCDLLDREAVGRCLAEVQPTVVIHLAARTDLQGRSLTDYAANIEGVHHLIDAVEATPSVQRCIWTSSQLVCQVGYIPRNDRDYRPNTVYGQSKVRTEEIVRRRDGGGREWCIVRPTTVWGPGMSPHYQRLLRLIREGRYFHVGAGPLLKSYSYIGNINHQYRCLAEQPAAAIHRRTFYLADYEPIDLIAWCDSFQRAFHARRIPHIPEPAARALARVGDALNAVGLTRFPFNSFRLRNILTQYCFDLEETRAVCGALPWGFEQGVAETVAWFNALPDNEKQRA
jgi:nucleoside-diphosphate-sugar epimerase